MVPCAEASRCTQLCGAGWLTRHQSQVKLCSGLDRGDTAISRADAPLVASRVQDASGEEVRSTLEESLVTSGRSASCLVLEEVLLGLGCCHGWALRWLWKRERDRPGACSHLPLESLDTAVCLP